MPVPPQSGKDTGKPEERPLRILGVDPGTVATGYGIIEKTGSEAVSVASGTIRTGVGRPISKRLKKIYDELLLLTAQFQPTVVAIEGTFMDKNIQTAMKLGQARGVALLAAEQSGLSVWEYAPRQIKLAVVGYGAADKAQVRAMVARLLRLTGGLESDHAADALAVALCHFHSAKLQAVAKRASSFQKATERSA